MFQGIYEGQASYSKDEEAWWASDTPTDVGAYFL